MRGKGGLCATNEKWRKNNLLGQWKNTEYTRTIPSFVSGPPKSPTSFSVLEKYLSLLQKRRTLTSLSPESWLSGKYYSLTCIHFISLSKQHRTWCVTYWFLKPVMKPGAAIATSTSTSHVALPLTWVCSVRFLFVCYAMFVLSLNFKKMIIHFVNISFCVESQWISFYFHLGTKII